MPSINAPENVFCATTVSLEGTGCDGAVLFEWTVVDKPTGATVNIASPNALATTATYDIEGVYKFRLCCFFEAQPVE